MSKKDVFFLVLILLFPVLCPNLVEAKKTGLGIWFEKIFALKNEKNYPAVYRGKVVYPSEKGKTENRYEKFFMPSPDEVRSFFHLVEQGEYLSLIAKKHGVSTKELLGDNPGIKDKNLIHPGQKILVVKRQKKSKERKFNFDFNSAIQIACIDSGIEPQIIKAIIRIESNFNPQAVSKKGAMGLMQLMPETAKDMGVNNPFDPRENIIAGTSYLAMMLAEFGDLYTALVAYNHGPTKARKYSAAGMKMNRFDYVKRFKNALLKKQDKT